MKECWRPVLYESVRKNMYEVSSFGRIRNIKTGKIMCGYKSCNGYIQINLMTDAEIPKSYVYKLHRIVASAFVEGFTSERCYVNHKDGNKTNNLYTNLEWVTFKENIQHAFRIGLVPSRKGCNNSNSKMDENVAKYIMFLLNRYDGKVSKVFEEIESVGMYGITYAMIREIKTGKCWGHISSKFLNSSNFKKETHLTKSEIKAVLKELDKDDNVQRVYDKLKDSIPFLTKDRVYRIKRRERYLDIIKEIESEGD